jgi:hypothetical protein
MNNIMNDNLIKCPITGLEFCYVLEISPEIKSYMSLSAGFWTNSLMTKDSKFFEEQMETLPELHKDLAWEDPTTGFIWLPLTVNVPDLGMVFANGASIDDWHWASVKSVKVTEEEKEKFKDTTNKEFPSEWKTDMSTIKRFESLEFIEALDYIGAFESLI